MENTIPVSDLRFYNQTLNDVHQGSQVILTKDGTAKYAVVEINEWRSVQATIRLFEELQKGYQSLRTEKTYTPDEFVKILESENG